MFHSAAHLALQGGKGESGEWGEEWEDIGISLGFQGLDRIKRQPKGKQVESANAVCFQAYYINLPFSS